jgi:hypothetical protein
MSLNGSDRAALRSVVGQAHSSLDAVAQEIERQAAGNEHFKFVSYEDGRISFLYMGLQAKLRFEIPLKRFSASDSRADFVLYLLEEPVVNEPKPRSIQFPFFTDYESGLFTIDEGEVRREVTPFECVKAVLRAIEGSEASIPIGDWARPKA